MFVIRLRTSIKTNYDSDIAYTVSLFCFKRRSKYEFKK